MQSKILFIVSFLLSTLFYIGWWNSSILTYADYKIYDFLTSSQSNPPSGKATVIVEIDEKSLRALGQWPWPRVVTASLIKKITAQHPAAVSLDLIFPEEDRTSPVTLSAFYNQFFNLKTDFGGIPDALKDNDRILADSMKNHNIVLPVFFNTIAAGNKECLLPSQTFLQENKTLIGLYESPSLLCSLPVIQDKAKAIGHIQASPDQDGTFRRVPLLIRYQNTLIPTLGLAALASIDPDIKWEQDDTYIHDITFDILGHRLTTDKKTNVLLEFYPQKWYRTISALDVLNGNYDSSLFQGKFVFIGATAMGLYDQYTLSDGSMRPGVFAHATLVENMMNNSVMTQPDFFKIINISLSGLLALIFMILMSRKQYIGMVVIFFAAILTGFLLSFIMLQKNIYISIGYFAIPLISYVFVLSMLLFFIHYRERKIFYEEMSKSNAAILESMALVAETRDTDTGAHITRTKEYIKLLAEYLKSQNIYTNVLTSEYIVNLYHAAPLHDIGKVGIPDNILKKNAKLTDEEFEIMKTHSLLGKEIIGNAVHAYHDTKMLHIAYNIAYYHHEKWNGLGYPMGLKGEKIPLEARIMALADVYDALISKRCYKPAFTFEIAEEIIIEGRGTHFDPLLVDTFIILKEEFKKIAEKIGDA
ncbi:MAG: CHASE2 domain-containing protein [Sulfuricurvum sp.]|uniref:CHASE2 domain-containing protein n=1 Tax=Sulfuricurvum sp. TaxID=2025608 RepID=UPI00262EAA54|nr:CHASE2 domain-containing protein [Sulfuricurvum sp.]MDD2950643.1 CHASE2 domain-containing protein [Sulfuricurvum sp.]MDD5116992.1 CHASE2 domain-containing protein [Sulfuricurvum sp.]